MSALLLSNRQLLCFISHSYEHNENNAIFLLVRRFIPIYWYVCQITCKNRIDARLFSNDGNLHNLHGIMEKNKQKTRYNKSCYPTSLIREPLLHGEDKRIRVISYEVKFICLLFTSRLSKSQNTRACC